MITHPGLEKSLSFIHTQLGGSNRKWAPAEDNRRCRIITISRQAGCGARAVADHLARYLQARTSSKWRWSTCSPIGALRLGSNGSST